MSDEQKTPPPPGGDFESHWQDMLRKARVQFMFGPGEQAAAGASSPDTTAPAQDDKAAETLQRIRSFNLKPKEVRDYLDRFVIRQKEAKKVLSVALCDHYNHVRSCLENPDLQEKDYAKQNVIIMGPTGVGKTYLVRCLARLIGVPFVKADATKFSETGYVGYDVEDMVRDLVKMADGNIDLARYGIIYVDEIDKIATRSGKGMRDVSGRGVQINLLKLMEDTEANLQSQTDLMGQVQAIMEMQQGIRKPRTINTRHMLFIVSGAFEGLTDIVRHRIESSSIGFRHQSMETDRTDCDILTDAQAEDFINFGFEPEFIGRLPVRVACEPLEADDLEQILLKSEDSILQQYIQDFSGYNIDFRMQPSAIHEIAGAAAQEKTGARGLMTVLERTLRDFKFELPSSCVHAFEMDHDIIRKPQEALNRLKLQDKKKHREMLRGEVGAFADRFRQAHGITLVFDPDATETLVDRSMETDKTIRALCEQIFRDYEYGLKLVQSRTGQHTFPVSTDVLAQPQQALSQWVVEQFKTQDGKTPPANGAPS